MAGSNRAPGSPRAPRTPPETAFMTYARTAEILSTPNFRLMSHASLSVSGRSLLIGTFSDGKTTHIVAIDTATQHPWEQWTVAGQANNEERITLMRLMIERRQAIDLFGNDRPFISPARSIATADVTIQQLQAEIKDYTRIAIQRGLKPIKPLEFENQPESTDTQDIMNMLNPYEPLQTAITHAIVQYTQKDHPEAANNVLLSKLVVVLPKTTFQPQTRGMSAVIASEKAAHTIVYGQDIHSLWPQAIHLTERPSSVRPIAEQLVLASQWIARLEHEIGEAEALEFVKAQTEQFLDGAFSQHEAFRRIQAFNDAMESKWSEERHSSLIPHNPADGFDSGLHFALNKQNAHTRSA